MNKLSIYIILLKYIKSEGARRIYGSMTLKRIAYNILRPSGKIILNVLGSKMQLSPRDRDIFETLVTGGLYEPYEVNMFCNSISEGMTVIDVGANFGYYTLIAAEMLKGKGYVYSFEPENEAFFMLQENIKLNNYYNIIPVKKGIIDKRGTRKLFLHESNPGMHSFIQTAKTLKNIDIETLTLDEYFGGISEPVNIGVIKIDTEGAEGLILKGARGIIDKHKPKIFMEYTPDWLEKAGTPALGLLEWLNNIGYDISIIDEKKEELRRVCVNELEKMWKTTRWTFQANLILSIRP